MTLSHGSRLTQQIIVAAIAVHRELGPGLLESVYEECLCSELRRASLKFERQVTLPIVYRDVRLECGYRLDLVVEDSVLLELKAVEALAPIHEAQMLTYLRLSKLKIGLLINFNHGVLKDGIRRFVL